MVLGMPNNLLRSLAAALVVTAAACGSSSDDDATTISSNDEAAEVVEAVAGDHTFALADDGPVSSGVVPIRLTNSGAEPHQVIVARLDDGKTVDDYLALIEAGDTLGADAMVTFAGGVNAVEPGATTEGWAELSPGTHVLVCFVPSPGGESHLHQGMISTIEVVDDGTPVAPPTDVVGELTLSDYAIAFPEGGAPTESGVYGFRNDGTEPHEMILLRLKDGKTLGDASAYAAAGMVGDAPYEHAGGAGVVAPGTTGYARLDLAPGAYIALCVIESPKEHKAHLDLGMVAPFVVE